MVGKVKLLFASTVPTTLDLFMRGQLSWIAGQGHEVYVVSSPGPELDRISTRETVSTHAIAMEREISLAADIRALREWITLLREIKPDVVVVGTPKAGLLGGLAAKRVGVPRRVYLMRGARFEGATGPKGRILRLTERISTRSAHAVIAVSQSLAELAVREQVVDPHKLLTVGSGSSNGVDTNRFRPPSEQERLAARSRFDLTPGQVAIGFVGRLHPDKGLDLLSSAISHLPAPQRGQAVLLVAGGNEGFDVSVFGSSGVEVRLLGRVEDVPGFLHACDLLVLPTQREGFPNVVLEAAASGLPVVTTNATGAVDSVIDGVTGYVVPKSDGRALGEALGQLISNADTRSEMGHQGRMWVEEEFANEVVWQGMLPAYLGRAV